MKNSSFIFIYIAFLSLAGCGKKAEGVATPEKQTEEKTTIHLSPEQAVNIQLRTGSAALKRLDQVLRVTGKLETPPSGTISVTSSLGGRVRIENEHLIPGMQVKAGQTLAFLEHESYLQVQQDFLECASRLEQTEKEYLRQKSLATDSISSAKKLEEAKAQWMSEKARYEGLSGKLTISGINPGSVIKNGILTSIPVVSPATGILSEVNVNPGKYIAPDQELFRILKGNHLHVVFRIFEKDAEGLAPGMEARFVLPGRKEEYISRISFISPSVQTAGEGLEVHCEIENQGSLLKAGMFVQGTIAMPDAETWAVSDSAIQNTNGKKFLFIEKAAGKYELAEVETGASSGGFTAIRFIDGRDPANQKIVISGGFSLLASLSGGEEE